MSRLRTMLMLAPALLLAAAARLPVAGAGSPDPAGASGAPVSSGAAVSGAEAGGAEAARPVVIELFTSQGCASCPPADRLLSELARDGSAGKVVALAFHVDYWNRLGWSDPFSSSRWSDRQQRYAHALSGDRLATPQVVIDGRIDCVGCRRDEVLRKIGAARAQPPVATVQLAVGAPDPTGAGSRLRVTATVRVQQAANRDLDLWVALTQSGLTTQVKGGENSAATLHDDFVVRRLEKAFTVRGRAGEQRTRELALALDPTWPLAELQVAAFAQDPRSLAIAGAAAVSVVPEDGGSRSAPAAATSGRLWPEKRVTGTDRPLRRR